MVSEHFIKIDPRKFDRDFTDPIFGQTIQDDYYKVDVKLIELLYAGLEATDPSAAPAVAQGQVPPVVTVPPPQVPPVVTVPPPQVPPLVTVPPTQEHPVVTGPSGQEPTVVAVPSKLPSVAATEKSTTGSSQIEPTVQDVVQARIDNSDVQVFEDLLNSHAFDDLDSNPADKIMKKSTPQHLQESDPDTLSNSPVSLFISYFEKVLLNIFSRYYR